jgi:hypothetical protein
MALEISDTPQQDRELGLSWRAGVTTNTGHSELQARNRTGYVPGPNDPSLEEAERLAREAEVARTAAAEAGEPVGAGRGSFSIRLAQCRQT